MEDAPDTRDDAACVRHTAQAILRKTANTYQKPGFKYGNHLREMAEARVFHRGHGSHGQLVWC